MLRFRCVDATGGGPNAYHENGTDVWTSTLPNGYAEGGSDAWSIDDAGAVASQNKGWGLYGDDERKVNGEVEEVSCTLHESATQMAGGFALDVLTVDGYERKLDAEATYDGSDAWGSGSYRQGDRGGGTVSLHNEATYSTSQTESWDGGSYVQTLVQSMAGFALTNDNRRIGQHALNHGDHHFLLSGGGGSSSGDEVIDFDASSTFNLFGEYGHSHFHVESDGFLSDTQSSSGGGVYHREENFTYNQDDSAAGGYSFTNLDTVTTGDDAADYHHEGTGHMVDEGGWTVGGGVTEGATIRDVHGIDTSLESGNYSRISGTYVIESSHLDYVSDTWHWDGTSSHHLHHEHASAWSHVTPNPPESSEFSDSWSYAYAMGAWNDTAIGAEYDGLLYATEQYPQPGPQDYKDAARFRNEHLNGSKDPAFFKLRPEVQQAVLIQEEEERLRNEQNAKDEASEKKKKKTNGQLAAEDAERRRKAAAAVRRKWYDNERRKARELARIRFDTRNKVNRQLVTEEERYRKEHRGQGWTDYYRRQRRRELTDEIGGKALFDWAFKEVTGREYKFWKEEMEAKQRAYEKALKDYENKKAMLEFVQKSLQTAQEWLNWADITITDTRRLLDPLSILTDRLSPEQAAEVRRWEKEYGFGLKDITGVSIDDQKILTIYVSRDFMKKVNEKEDDYGDKIHRDDIKLRMDEYGPNREERWQKHYQTVLKNSEPDKNHWLVDLTLHGLPITREINDILDADYTRLLRHLAADATWLMPFASGRVALALCLAGRAESAYSYMEAAQRGDALGMATATLAFWWGGCFVEGTELNGTVIAAR